MQLAWRLHIQQVLVSAKRCGEAVGGHRRGVQKTEEAKMSAGHRSAIVVPVAIVGLVLITVIVYANSVWGTFHFDDFWDITFNPQIRSLDDLLGAFPGQRWLSYSSFFLDRQIYGDGFVLGWHITNILLHVLTTLSLFWLIRLLYGQREGASPVAFLAAFIFALHPLAAEPVNYIRARTAILYSLFAILATCGAIVCHRSRTVRGRLSGAAIAVACLLLAALSKEVGAGFAVGLILLYFVIHVRLTRCRLAVTAGVLIATAIPLLLWFRSSGVLTLFRRLSGNTILPTHVLCYTTVFWRYVGLALFPHPSLLSVDHHILYPPNRWYGVGDVDVILSIIGLGLLVATVWWLRRRHKPAAYLLAMVPLCVAPYFFIVTMDLLVEYKFYLPLAGFCGLAAILLDRVRRRQAKAFAVCVVSLALFFGLSTVSRNRVWRTDLSLWQDAYEKAPRRARTMNAYAWALAFDEENGDLDRALTLALRSFDRNHVDVWPGFYPYMVDTVAFVFFFKQKTAYEIMPSLVGSEMCIRDRLTT